MHNKRIMLTSSSPLQALGIPDWTPRLERHLSYEAATHIWENCWRRLEKAKGADSIGGFCYFAVHIFVFFPCLSFLCPPLLANQLDPCIFPCTKFVNVSLHHNFFFLAFAMKCLLALTKQQPFWVLPWEWNVRNGFIGDIICLRSYYWFSKGSFIYGFAFLVYHYRCQKCPKMFSLIAQGRSCNELQY